MRTGPLIRAPARGRVAPFASLTAALLAAALLAVALLAARALSLSSSASLSGWCLALRATPRRDPLPVAPLAAALAECRSHLSRLSLLPAMLLGSALLSSAVGSLPALLPPAHRAAAVRLCERGRPKGQAGAAGAARRSCARHPQLPRLDVGAKLARFMIDFMYARGDVMLYPNAPADESPGGGTRRSRSRRLTWRRGAHSGTDGHFEIQARDELRPSREHDKRKTVPLVSRVDVLRTLDALATMPAYDRLPAISLLHVGASGGLSELASRGRQFLEDAEKQTRASRGQFGALRDSWRRTPMELRRSCRHSYTFVRGKRGLLILAVVRLRERSGILAP